MSELINKPLKDCCLPATGEQEICLSAYKGKNLVLYFYPKDNTPGCTQEGQDFRDMYADFQAAGAEILGVSRDSIRSHENFKAKYKFPFELLSDKDEVLCKQLDVIQEKKLYGRVYMGVDRSTFLIDSKGVIRQVWRSVKVKGHAEEVLAAVKQL